MLVKKQYTIYYIKKRGSANINLNQQIQSNEEEIKEEFTFVDYYSTQTIRNLKEYFLSSFGHKYKSCYCQLYLLRKTNGNIYNCSLTLITLYQLLDSYQYIY